MPDDLIALIRAYCEAANRHDLAAVAAMLTEDVTYELTGQDVLTGKERVLALHAYEAGIGAGLELRDCAVEGERVICWAVERNRWLAAAGLTEVAYSRIVYSLRDNLIHRVVASMDPESLHRLGEVMHSFLQWLAARRRQELAQLFTAEGDFVYSRENGDLAVKLLREWQADRTS